MKLKFISFLLIIASNSIFSQEKVIGSNGTDALNASTIKVNPNGKIENGTYSCLKFDWNIKIPEGYVLDAATVVLPNGTVVSQNPTHLIGFEVDKRNTFLSSFESLAGSKITSLEDHKNFIVKLFNDTYSKIETLKFDVSSSNMRIGNYDFYKVQTRLYDSKTDELLLTQDLYNSFINNNLFSVNINYNNPNIGKLLTENFISSLSN
ncbi:MAG: hypothetical protein ABIQ27_07005 [Flavobacterium sp.]|uniref:hypothetical protein n=1 Tax=Flavobacterium sp. TaxID=239 RepID=UPI003262DC4D